MSGQSKEGFEHGHRLSAKVVDPLCVLHVLGFLKSTAKKKWMCSSSPVTLMCVFVSLLTTRLEVLNTRLEVLRCFFVNLVGKRPLHYVESDRQ
jgi:hypothetical protein